ncbi:hypothetical protein MM213_18145 [Belliella sp. R4-6]|uniref:Uncharacterized protein n=1 Tax=Belliella alkalica TaxID=1730871 RepID=A0ABS9VG52_9BACT|nr:hypothetical protein [Belliella alkalica]MCH7415427.1 hypothetical protein [Belliella alkalica]
MKSELSSHILSISKWLFVPLLLFSFKISAQDRTVRFIYSIDDKVPLSYLRVLSDDGKQAFFTDIKGKFEFPQAQTAEKTSFNISGYGINDTLISIQQVMSKDTLFLKAKEYELPEVIINSSHLSELKIGDSSAQEFEVDKPIESHDGLEGVYYRYTIRVKVPKRKSLVLDEIKFYVSKILEKQVEISLRILVPKAPQRIISGKRNSIDDFTDLLPSSKIVAVAKPGWQQIKFSEPVQVPSRASDLFIVFDLLEEQPKSKFAIVNQRTSKDIDIGFYDKGGAIGVFHSESFHPAIEVIFLK